MKKIFLLALVVTLNACALYKDPKVPEMDIPEEFKVDIQFESKDLQNEWWKNFNDEKLNHLVDLALKNNYNYRVTLKNIDISATYIAQNTSYLYPQVTTDFYTSRDRFTEYEFIGFPVETGGGATPIGPYDIGTNASSSSSTIFPPQIFNIQALMATATYEVDVWNQIRNSIKEAKANVVVSTAQSNVTKLTLIGNVVNSYYQIMTLNAIMDNYHEQYKAAQELTELYKVQYESKLISKNNVLNAESQEEAILISLQNAEKQKKILEYSLAYLVGAYPENFHVEPYARLNEIQLAQLVPEGLPSQMIAMRPDIQAAYFQVMSYGYIEKQAMANFLPSFNLTGLYGYAYPTFEHLFDEVNSFWSYGLGVSQYVFDYAIKESEYDRAGIQFEASILSYKDTVVNAFYEVNSALASYEEDHEMLLSYLEQDTISEELLAISDANYHGGVSDYTAHLNSEINVLRAEYNVVNQQLLVIQDIIQVYKALGLGLNVEEETEEETDATD